MHEIISRHVSKALTSPLPGLPRFHHLERNYMASEHCTRSFHAMCPRPLQVHPICTYSVVMHTLFLLALSVLNVTCNAPKKKTSFRAWEGSENLNFLSCSDRVKIIRCGRHQLSVSTGILLPSAMDASDVSSWCLGAYLRFHHTFSVRTRNFFYGGERGEVSGIVCNAGSPLSKESEEMIFWMASGHV